MLITSEEYLAAILAMSRTDRITGTLTRKDGTVLDLTDSNLEEDSVSISRECVTGEELEFGSAVMAQLDFSLRTEESRYVFYDATVSLAYGIQLPDGSWFDVPLGQFTVVEAERKNTLVQMTAYDNLLAMDDDYGGAVLYGTPYEIILAICEHCGLLLATTEEEFLAMPNGAEIIQIDETSGCTTWRDCAKVVAQMIGCFIVADRAGAVALRQYGKESSLTLPKRNRFATTMADYICAYMGLRINGSSGEYRSYDVNQEEGLELTIEDAPAWDYGLEETLQARADALLQELIQIRYTPGSFTMTGNPAIECGDLLTLETDDGTVTTMVTEISWKYRGRMSVKSAGVNPYLQNRTTRKTVILRELQTQTTENKLIFYSFTNQNAVSVSSGGDEEQVSQVTFVTTKPTSAMFIAQLPLVVEAEDTVTTERHDTEKTYSVTPSATVLDADGNPVTFSVVVTDTDTTKTVTPGYVDLVVEYYLMGTLVDYELIHRCRAGSHIIGLFYTFDALDGDSNYQWQVKIRVTGGSGTVTVPKRGFRATVTGQGMAGTEDWDGTLSFDDSVPRLAIASTMRMASASEELTTSTQVPMSSGIEETVTRFGIASRMTVSMVEGEIGSETGDDITVEEIVVQQTAEFGGTAYTETVEGLTKLRTVYEYHSEVQSVDIGSLICAAAVTNDKVSVEGMEVVVK